MLHNKIFLIFLVWIETCSSPPSPPNGKATSSRDSCLPPTPTSWTWSAPAAMRLQWYSAMRRPSWPATTARTSSPSPLGASASSLREAPSRSKFDYRPLIHYHHYIISFVEIIHHQLVQLLHLLIHTQLLLLLLHSVISLLRLFVVESSLELLPFL